MEGNDLNDEERYQFQWDNRFQRTGTERGTTGFARFTTVFREDTEVPVPDFLQLPMRKVHMCTDIPCQAQWDKTKYDKKLAAERRGQVCIHIMECEPPKILRDPLPDAAPGAPPLAIVAMEDQTAPAASAPPVDGLSLIHI